jgi:hypothetical protein
MLHAGTWGNLRQAPTAPLESAAARAPAALRSLRKPALSSIAMERTTLKRWPARGQGGPGQTAPVPCVGIADDSDTSPMASSSCLDVLDAFFDFDPGALGHATPDAVGELQVRLIEFYASWSPPAAADEIRLYFDTALQRGFVPGMLPAASLSYMSSELRDMDDETARLMAYLRRKYTAGLLYADRIVVVDPVSRWAYAGFHEETWELAAMWKALLRVAPLVRNGYLLLVPITPPCGPGVILPPAPRWQHDFAAAVHAARRNPATFHEGWSPKTPRGVRHHTALDSRVVEALAVVDLPLVTDVSVEALVAIRAAEDCFGEWRAGMRVAARLLGDFSDVETFSRDAHGVYADLLVPRAQAVRRSLSRSSALRAAVREQPVRTTLGAVAGAAAAAITGAPLGGTLASTVAGGIAQMVVPAVTRAKPTGSAAVLATLLGDAARRHRDD